MEQIVRHVPLTESELADLNGVGKVRAAKAKSFLPIIRQVLEKHNLKFDVPDSAPARSSANNSPAWKTKRKTSNASKSPYFSSSHRPVPMQDDDDDFENFAYSRSR